MTLVVIVGKRIDKYKDALGSTVRMYGPAHDKRMVHTGELTIYIVDKEGKEEILHTYAAGKWDEFYPKSDLAEKEEK